MTEKLMVDLQKGTQTFRFHLLHRPLVLGTAGAIRYYWMDSRQFRTKNPGPNYRACVDSWWADVELYGETHLPENQFNLVLAQCFPLINTAHSLQDVYRDAHLHPKADREIATDTRDDRPPTSLRTYRLPDEEYQRLQALARQRDPASVRAELENLFLGRLPSPQEQPRFDRACQIWAGNGIVALKTGGRDALQSYLHHELLPWLNRYRRRGGDDQTRLFINLFSYQCKLAFYLCYANAWIGLIHHLVQHHGLDPLSQRFLRYWHYQNRPIGNPIALDGSHRDVFCGQILALHPLSAILFSEPDYLLILGHWFGHPDFDTLHQQNRVTSCHAYWEMVAAILSAAHEYAHSYQRWTDSRPGRPIGSQDSHPELAQNDSPPSSAWVFEDYVHNRGIVCRQCRAPLLYQHHEFPGDGEFEVSVHFRCQGSGHPITLPITHDDLRDHLSRTDE
jgi:hypothetical protein